MPELILSKHHCFKTSCFTLKARHFSAKLYVTFLIFKEMLILTTFASQKVHTFCWTKIASFKKKKNGMEHGVSHTQCYRDESSAKFKLKVRL